jgi:hypothetical protein
MPAQLIAGVLEYFACYLRTGSEQAARRVVLLLDRLALDPDVDAGVRAQGRELAETIRQKLGVA